jgi:hypothetical protein
VTAHCNFVSSAPLRWLLLLLLLLFAAALPATRYIQTILRTYQRSYTIHIVPLVYEYVISWRSRYMHRSSSGFALLCGCFYWLLMPLHTFTTLSYSTLCYYSYSLTCLLSLPRWYYRSYCISYVLRVLQKRATTDESTTEVRPHTHTHTHIHSFRIAHTTLLSLFTPAFIHITRMMMVW